MSAGTRGKLFIWGLPIAVTAGLMWFLNSTEAGRVFSTAMFGVSPVSEIELRLLRRDAVAYYALLDEQQRNAKPPENPCGKVFTDIVKGVTTTDDLNVLYRLYDDKNATLKVTEEPDAEHRVDNQVWTFWVMRWEEFDCSSYYSSPPPRWHAQVNVLLNNDKVDYADYQPTRYVYGRIKVKK